MALASVIFAAPTMVLGAASPALAQVLRPEVRIPFLADPLQDVPLDPLLPNPPVPRPLSPLEQYALEQDLDRLALEAEALNQAGNAEEALELWMREVRLRRLLGIERELVAIQRVAQWMRDLASTQELQLLSARLDQIQAQQDISVAADRARLEDMAATYTILGDVEAAVAIHRTLADIALAAGDRATYQTQVETLTSLQADWFYFQPAAEAYGELVQLTAAAADRDDQIRYQLAQSQNLEQAQQFEAAIAVQQQLITLYSTDETQWPLIPAVQHRVGQNYRTLGNLEEASRNYQAAYTNAIANRQLNVASTAIRDLAAIYKTLERVGDLGYLYEQLLLVERQASNAYGLMETFDQLGQLYEQTGEPEAALSAYREGLILARSLGHRQDYFESQITRLTAPSPTSG
ncbi:MAG: hypothetical protein ACFCVD_03695 [Nodosilinea sp.]